MSQNYETFYSTLSNMRAYEQQCYNFLDYFIHFSLSSQHISLRLQHSFLSLLSGLHLSVAPYFFLNFIFFYLSVSASLSLSFFFLSLSFSLSFLVTKKAIPIWSRARQLKLANLKLYSPRGSHRSLLVVLHSRSSLLVVLHCSLRRWLVEFGHWLICWVGVLLKILSLFLKKNLVEIFGFGICWRIRWLWL